MESVYNAVSEVQNDVAKVKAMTLLFDERLRVIEESIIVSRGADGADSGASAKKRSKR